MATHSSIFAWKSPWTEELGGLQSMGYKELDTTERLSTHTHKHLEITESELKGTSAITYHNHLIFQLKILRSRQKAFVQGHIANPSQSGL